ncbi:Uncharacterised protein [Pseudomonas aeruginosa]|nr:Uncharacterised protein [Pseudomonas aeruginosa]
MQQPRGGHRDTPGPCAAADQQARLAAFDLQQLALGRLGEDRLDHMLALGERRHLGQVGIGRLPGEILLEVVRRHRGVHVAVLDLHRDIVLVVHDQRVEHPLAFAHVQCQGALGAGDLLAEGDHLATMAMPAGRDLVGDVVHLEQRRLALGLGDEGSYPLHAHQQAVAGQFAQGAIDGHATEAELADQFALGRHPVVRRPGARLDLADDHLLDPRVERRRYLAKLRGQRGTIGGRGRHGETPCRGVDEVSLRTA